MPNGNASVDLCGTCVAPGAESDCSVDCSGVFTAAGAAGRKQTVELAIGETVTLLHRPLPSCGISIGMERGCQQNDCHAGG